MHTGAKTCFDLVELGVLTADLNNFVGGSGRSKFRKYDDDDDDDHHHDDEIVTIMA